MPATRTISISPSPSRRQPRRSASSRSFTVDSKVVGAGVGRGGRLSRLRISRVPDGDAVEERREVLQPEAGGDVVDARVARAWIERPDFAQLAQRRARPPRPFHAVQAL